MTIATNVALLDESNDPINGSNPLPVIGGNGLVTESYDYIDLTYTGDNITTVVYKDGGAGGTTVATLTLTYSGDKILTITRT